MRRSLPNHPKPNSRPKPIITILCPPPWWYGLSRTTRWFLGHEVGGARVTITDVATGQLLASGLQQGEPGDQSQIMRTPHLMEEPIYSGRSAASFTTTIELARPTLVEIAAEGPLAYPSALQRASTTVLLIPGHDLINDGIVLQLYGYLVQVEHPKPGESLIAKEDVMLQASGTHPVRLLVRPHSDWDSRKIQITANF